MHQRRIAEAQMARVFAASWGPLQVRAYEAAESRLGEMDQLIEGAQTKDAVGLRNQREPLANRREKLLERKQDAAQALADAFDSSEIARLWENKGYRDATEANDPGAMKDAVLALMKTMAGKETLFDFAHDLAAHSESESLKQGLNVAEHLEQHGSRLASIPEIFLSVNRFPDTLTDAQKVHIEYHNEKMQAFICMLSLSDATHGVRRQMEGNMDDEKLKQMPFAEYAIRLAALVRANELSRSTDHSRVAGAGATVLAVKVQRQEGKKRESTRRDVTQVRCFRCREYGHYQSDCDAPLDEEEETSAAPAISPAELKLLRRLLAGAEDGAGATAANRGVKGFAAVARVATPRPPTVPLISAEDDEDGDPYV